MDRLIFHLTVHGEIVQDHDKLLGCLVLELVAAIEAYTFGNEPERTI